MLLVPFLSSVVVVVAAVAVEVAVAVVVSVAVTVAVVVVVAVGAVAVAVGGIFYFPDDKCPRMATSDLNPKATDQGEPSSRHQSGSLARAAPASGFSASVMSWHARPKIVNTSTDARRK